MSFMVTVRERKRIPSLSEELGLLMQPNEARSRFKWVVLERFEAATAKEGLDRAFALLANNPECSVTIMRKR